MDYDKAYEELDGILTTTNNIHGNDIVSVNGIPFATTLTGEALRGLLRDEIAFAMEDFGLTALAATDKVVSKMAALDEDDLKWWRTNGWFQGFV